MKKNLLFITLIIPIFYSCLQDRSKEERSVISSEQNGTENASTNQEELYDTIRQINDDYLGKILSYKNPINSRTLYSSAFKTEVSEYNNNVIDTLLTLSRDKNSFTYYTSGSKESIGDASITKFNIETNSIYLPDSIHIDMTKRELTKKLKLKPFNQVLLLTEQEGYQQLYFTFHKNKLVRVAFESTYMD